MENESDVSIVNAPRPIAREDLPQPVSVAVLGENLLDLVQESLIICDADGRIVGWNKASERIYGWSRTAAEGRQFEQLLGAPEWLDIDPTALRTTATETGREVIRKAACGREVIVATQLSVHVDPAGGPLSWIETGIDVTSHRHAALAAQAEQRHYRNVFHAVPAAVWDIDFSQARAIALGWLKQADADPLQWFTERPDKVRELMRATFVRDVNEQAMSLFGPCSRDDLLVSIERYWPDSSMGDFTRWLVSALAGEPYFTCETRQCRFDGDEFDALFTASFAPGAIETGCLVVSIVDHSAVKLSQAAVRESEAFYTDLFNASAFSAWHLDATETKPIYAELRAAGVTDIRDYIREYPDTLDRLMAAIKVVDVNCTTLQLFEAADRSEIIGQPITQFWFRDRPDALIGSIEASFNDRPIYKSLSRMRTLTGKEIDVLYTRSASTALHSAGQLLLAIVDMTDKVQAQNALAEMQATLAHAARVSSLGELTASIAHEVNQPLAAIAANGEAALLRLDQPSPELDKLRGLTEDMIADARRASEVVAHIRSMASPQPGQYRPVSLNAVVSEALTLVGPQLEKCGTVAILDLKPGLAETLGDPVQLQQVVVNLILNAVHALEGIVDPRLCIRTRRDGRGIQLAIEDNGVGIPANSIDKLFNSFFTTKSDGMGIGLAICRTIVEAHGGEISAENMPEGGARFTVGLPAASPVPMT